MAGNCYICDPSYLFVFHPIAFGSILYHKLHFKFGPDRYQMKKVIALYLNI